MIDGDHHRPLGSLLSIRIANFADALSLMLLQSASVPLLMLMVLLLLLINPLVLLLLLSIRDLEHENIMTNRELIDNPIVDAADQFFAVSQQRKKE